MFPSIRKSCCCWYKSGVLPFTSFPIITPSSFVTANSGIIAKAPLPCCFSIVYLKEVPSVSPFFFIFCKTGTPIVIVTISTLVSVIWKLTPLPLPLVPWTTSWLTLVGEDASAWKPGTTPWVAIPLLTCNCTSSKFNEPSEFITGVSFKKIDLCQALLFGTLLWLYKPSIWPSDKTSIIFACDLLSKESASVLEELPPPFPPPPEPAIKFCSVI